jgi:hypothetical protein
MSGMIVWGTATVRLPASVLGAREWLEMFQGAGFVSDDESTAPEEPVTVYRGALKRHMRGFSWTSDIEMATWSLHADREAPGCAVRGRFRCR